MSELVSWKNSVDGFEVEFEAISPVDFSGVKDERQLEILEGLQNVNEQIRVNQDLINKLNADIDRLTNSADGLDYTIAVASGIIAGLIDSFFVGEFSIDNAKDFYKAIIYYISGMTDNFAIEIYNEIINF